MKKIVVKAPQSLEDLIYTYPFLKTLEREFKESELNLIVNEGSQKLAKMLPIDFKIFELPHAKNTFPGIHKYCVNLNDVFNIDTFIDLENSLKSSFIGFSFKSKDRIGYQNGVNKFLLTHKLDGKAMPHAQDKGFKLLAHYLEREIEARPSILEKRRDIKSDLFKDHSFQPYLLIVAEKWNDDLKALLLSLQDQRILLNECQIPKNEQIYLKEKGNIEIIALDDVNVNEYIEKSLAVLSFMPWLTMVANLRGVFTVGFSEQDQPPFLFSSHYCQFYPWWAQIKNGIPQKLTINTESRDITGFDQLSDLLIEKIEQNGKLKKT